MKLVDVQEAKAHFCEYLAAAEWCEEILIARHDEPVARLGATETAAVWIGQREGPCAR